MAPSGDNKSIQRLTWAGTGVLILTPLPPSSTHALQKISSDSGQELASICDVTERPEGAQFAAGGAESESESA